MPGRPIHSAQRAIQDLTLGIARSDKRAVRRAQELGLREVILNFQSTISGTARSTPGFAQVTVNFPYTFYFAPGNRDSDLERPQFWPGFECDGDVMLSAHVKEWDTNVGNGGTIGAVVRVGFMAAAEVTFNGMVHMSFQGYGDLSDGDSPDDDLA